MLSPRTTNDSRSVSSMACIADEGFSRLQATANPSPSGEGGLSSKASGEPLPKGVAVGPDGLPTTDAVAASQGALAPFGGHKGYGLGLVLGLLAGPLLGAKVGKALGQSVKDGHYDKGDLLIAIDPAAFGDAATFRAAVEA